MTRDKLVDEIADMTRDCMSRLYVRDTLLPLVDRYVAEREEALRELLWLRHGHLGLYGDDGEMSCGDCLIDFKRSSPEDIKTAFQKLGEQKVVAQAERERALVELALEMGKKAEMIGEGRYHRFGVDDVLARFKQKEQT